MKKSLTLRTKLSIWMALIVLFLSIALLMTLYISKVFLRLDSESFLQLSKTASARTNILDEQFGAVMIDTGHVAEELADALIAEAANSACAPGELYRNDAAIARATIIAAEAAANFLGRNDVTGTFVLFNGSHENPGDEWAHTAVYIRHTPAENRRIDGQYTLEIGSDFVMSQLLMAGSAQRQAELRFDANYEASNRFYSQPIWASQQMPQAGLARYGYWMTPTDILGDGHVVITYSLPLLDAEGKAFGVIGAEIEVSAFVAEFLPSAELFYPNSFYAIASRNGDQLRFDWSVVSGKLAQIRLESQDEIALVPINIAGEDIYQVSINDFGELYVAVRPLKLYGANSPFQEENWSLASFVFRDELHSGSKEIQGRLLASIAFTTVIALFAVVLFGYLATRKISGLSKYISNLSAHDDIQFERTGMREIDELSSAVEKFNQSVINASKTTSRVLELTLLPIGGYEIIEETKQVVLTEYIYQFFHMEPGTPVSKQRWEEMLEALKKEPLPDIEGVYCYYDTVLEKTRWVRLVEAETENGILGILVDESKTIEERQRLANELDFDNLTRLYNRNAFKREVNRAIKANPDKLGVMIFADLDNLKKINDSLGHEAGDRLIIRAAEIFQKLSTPGGIVSRISGDEFAMYLHGYDDPEKAREIVYKYLNADESHTILTPDGQRHQVLFSAGLAWYPQDSDNETDLLKLSDFAMYEAKQKKKGSIHEFDWETYRKKTNESNTVHDTTKNQG